MRRTFLSLAAAVGLVAAAVPLAAQGFSVNEHGACQTARGGAGVASPCADGSAILYNPAGIVGPRGWTISAGVTGIYAFGDFMSDATRAQTDLKNGVIPVPHVYITDGLSDKVAVGVGFFVPYGLGTKWDSTSVARYVGYDNSLQTYYIQPTIAVQPDPALSIGAGLDIVHGTVRLTQRLDLSTFDAQPGITFGMLGISPGTDFAAAKLTGNGTTVGAHFGVIAHPAPWLSIGARYLMRAKVKYSGTVTFTQVPTGIILPPDNPLSLALGLDPTQPLPLDAVLATQFLTGGALGNQAVSTSITMPDQATAGIAVQATPKLKVLADLQWMHWALFNTLNITFTNAATPNESIIAQYRDTWAGRFGLDYAAADGLDLRVGYLRHGGAAPPQTVTPLLPEGLRNEFTGGIGYQITPQLHADVAYQYVRQQDRRGRVINPPSGVAPTTALNSGLYHFAAHLVAVTLTARF